MIEHLASLTLLPEFRSDAQVQDMGGVHFDSHDGVGLDKVFLSQYAAAVPEIQTLAKGTQGPGTGKGCSFDFRDLREIGLLHRAQVGMTAFQG
jgi:hypothetical protein